MSRQISQTDKASHPAEQKQWHALAADDVLTLLQGHRSGLSTEEVDRASRIYGLNTLPSPRGKGFLLRFIQQFHNVLIYVLLASASITLLLGHYTDSLVILAVVLANAVIGVIQEGKAESAMASIRKIIAPRASVIRDGHRLNIDGQEVVPGDIVILEAGEKVPADLRLLESNDLSIQEALLTGESLPVSKSVDPVPTGQILAERSCMAFSGTMVTRGRGTGVVVATGSSSELGKISSLVGKVEELQTPLITQMNVFARWLTFLILIMGALLFAHGTFLGHQDPEDLFMAIVGLSVAAIPEGLPAVLTITLAIGVQAMARRNAIVRRLPAIETLGSVSVICTDKTGTLTFNEMAATSLCIADQALDVTGDGYDPSGEIVTRGHAAETSPPSLDDRTKALLHRVGRAVTLCNDAHLKLEKNDWSVVGDPMEGALLVLARKIGGMPDDGWLRRAVLPFDARRRFMATLDVKGGPSPETRAFVKGAPERLLAMCTSCLDETGGTRALDEGLWHERATELARQGQRVLAIAEKPMPVGQTTLAAEDVESGMILIGLIGLMDPPRPEAVESVERCLSAGIRVKMITGDHAGTASAIGKRIGLLQPDSVLTGADIDVLSDTELREAVMETDVFARTSPEHKLRLVAALQAENLTVAMTGDGVNDAPALKRADAGIAMGLKGSEAARESADLVLADDNFRSIADAVSEGRTVYDNIVKVIAWTLPTSTAEALVIVAALLFGLTLPVTPVQILWVNLITAATLGLALAFEPGEPETMSRPPRDRTKPILTGELAWYILLVSALFMAAVFALFVQALERGQSITYARSLAVDALVVLEIFQLLFVRTMNAATFSWRNLRGTPAVWLAVGIVLAGQSAITFVPALQEIFAMEPLLPVDLAAVFGLGIALFAILEVEKRMRMALRRSEPRRVN